MKRIIYSVGFFLLVFFLCAGFVLSYQVTELRERLYNLEESSARAQQTVSALTDARGQRFIFEQYEKGKLKRESYRITAYGNERVVLRREVLPQEKRLSGQNVGFRLRVEDGFVVVYKKDTKEVFEYTDIPFEALPQEMQTEVLLGKTLENLDDLYDFLENYSS